MSAIEILKFIGIPTLSGTLLIGVFATSKVQFLKMKKEHDSSKLGIQALLRNELYKIYEKWYERGYAPLWVRENFENIYQQYHNLGQNGVMDNIHEKFMALPTSKKGE